MFVQQAGAAFLLVTLTLWLQSAGSAALIAWVRPAVAGDIHKLGPLHSTALVVRLTTTAVVALHALERSRSCLALMRQGYLQELPNQEKCKFQ